MTARQGREPILILGFVTGAVAYFLMLLNLPAASPIRETLPGETGLMTPSSTIVLVTGFLLGFSDSCFMTQVSLHYVVCQCLKVRNAFRPMPFWRGLSETTLLQHSAYLNSSNLWRFPLEPRTPHS